MAGKQQAFAKDITSATEFEQELQLSWKEGGITVVDVYSTIWGPCRAIQPTFRRLFLEADDTVKLRFLTADSTLILKELSDSAQSAQTAVRREIPRPKNLEAVKETLPAHWTPILQAHEGKPKPLFLFWKEGRLAHQIDGVHTPEIVEMVRNLAAVKTHADEYLTNLLLLDNWCEYFSREDSEVKFDAFVSALTAICMLSVPLAPDELATLRDALKIGRNGTVSAANLQKWVGNEMTLTQAFARLLPGYEERAMAVRLHDEHVAAAKEERDPVVHHAVEAA